MNTERHRAIVLWTVDFGEADQMVTLLTERVGKIVAVAKGARRSRRRYPGLDLAAAGEIEISPRRSDVWLLGGFEVSRSVAASGDLIAIAQSAYVVELVREMSVPNHAEPEAFSFIDRLLGVLAARALSALELRAFEIGLLDRLGLGPAIDRCAVCGKVEIDLPGQRYDPARGGVICASCGGYGTPLGAEARALLLLARSIARGEEATASSSGMSEARAALGATFARHLTKPLASSEFLRKVARDQHGQ